MLKSRYMSWWTRIKSVDKKVWSWSLYDWANSTFATTVMAGFFPIFFKEYWSQGTDPTLTTARLGTALSLSGFLLAVTSPLLGAMADHRGSKKWFLFTFTAIACLCCVALATVNSGDWFSAAFLYGIAMYGFYASAVFYDSLLPSVAPGKKANFASSLGYSLGYLGGGVLFLINIIMFQNPQLFGLESGTQAVKVAFVMVAVWWLLFSIPLFKNVPEPSSAQKSTGIVELTQISIKKLTKTAKEIWRIPSLRYFLLGYWLYIDGVYTVMTMAVDFGMSLGFNSSHLITALLLVQFIGFPCALLFSKIANRYGSRTPILICIGVYFIAVIGSSQMTHHLHFYALAAIVGMVQGGVQALSRSLFSQMIPEKSSGEYFGIYNLISKMASVFGPLLVGFGAYLTGNPRAGMLSLLVLFFLGAFFLRKVQEPA